MGDQLPAPLALTVAFMALWALLLGLVVVLAAGAERYQREIDELEEELRGSPRGSEDAPR